ncbi:MAG: hypothetical protein WDM80_13550 [Limisphaerales bacterium]
MAKKIIKWGLVLLVAGFGSFVVYGVISLFIPRHGEAIHVSELKKAFSKAGPEIEAAFTNSLIQKFPFSGTIVWRLTLLKDPFLTLDANVDPNALRAFIAANSGTQFFWSGTDGSNQNWFADEWPTKEEYPLVNWTSISFGTTHTNQFGAVINGTFDIVSNRMHFWIH